VNIERVMERVDTSEATGLTTIQALVDAQVLAKAPRSRRAPVWLATSVLDEIEDLSRRTQAAAGRGRD